MNAKPSSSATVDKDRTELSLWLWHLLTILKKSISMKALDLLRQEASERRVYRTTSNIMDTISRCVADFQQRYPDTDWSPSSELVAGARYKGGMILQCVT
jgi:hypothetical protein